MPTYILRSNNKRAPSTFVFTKTLCFLIDLTEVFVKITVEGRFCNISGEVSELA